MLKKNFLFRSLKKNPSNNKNHFIMHWC